MSYRLEYATSNRAGCKGPMPCKGTKIEKGTLRVGTMVTIKDNQTMAWRHWGCVTPKIISNFNNTFDQADEMDGFEDLTPEDQEKVKTAFAEGNVADEDIPDSARKPAKDDEGEDGEGAPKKGKKAPAKGGKKAKKADEDAEQGGDAEEEKPKKKRAAKKAASDEEAEEEEEKPKTKKAKTTKQASKKAASDEEVEEEEKKPKAKRGRPPKKAAKKDESEDEAEEEEKPAPKKKPGRKPKAAKADDDE